MASNKELCRGLSSNDEEYMTLSYACDKLTACESKNIITATRFLDTHKQALCERMLKSMGIQNYFFDGGYPDAERKICVFLPDYPIENDTITALRAEKSRQDNLSHRDYLGSLMGLGIKREYIGDILVHENGADIIVLEEIVDYLMLEYRKAGKKQLELSIIDKATLKTGEDSFTIIKESVSSMRFDLITATAFSLSRTLSSEMIEKGKVLLNGLECAKPDKQLSIGDKINIRGRGKIEILSELGKSKKGKTIIEMKKY